MLWTAELHALESDVAYKGGEYTGRPQLKAVQDIHHMMLTTPAYRANLVAVAEPDWSTPLPVSGDMPPQEPDQVSVLLL